MKFTVTTDCSSETSTPYFTISSFDCWVGVSSPMRIWLMSLRRDSSMASNNCISCSINCAGIWYVSLFMIDAYSYFDKFAFCDTTLFEVVQDEAIMPINSRNVTIDLFIVLLLL